MINKLFYRFCWLIIWIVVAACVWMQIRITLMHIEIRQTISETHEINERIRLRLQQ